MYRRIFNWPSLGLIYNLSNMSQEALKNVAGRLKSQGGERIQDRGLSSQLSKFTEDSFKGMVSPNRCSSLPVPSLSDLRKAPEANVVYHPGTVAEFHFLLVRLLLSFSRALWRLAQAHRWSPKRFKKEGSERQPQNNSGEPSQTNNILEAVDKVVPIAYNLFVVVNSNALRKHLELLDGLDTELKLMVPTEDRKSTYNKFVRSFVEGKDGMIEKSKPVSEFPGVMSESSTMVFPGAGGDDGVEESRPGFGREGGSDTARPEVAGDNGFRDEEDKEGEEYAAVAHSAEMARLAKMTGSSTFTTDAIFRRWILTFVIHFTAKYTLEKETRQFPQVIVKFHLMSMSRTKEKSSSWEDMKGYICKAVVSTGPFPSWARSLAELSIKKLDDVVNHPNKQAFVPRASPQILKSNGLLDQACQHSEAVLATLMRIRGDKSEVRKVTQDTRLIDLITVFSLLVVCFLGLTGDTGPELGEYWNIKALLPSLLGPIEGVKVWTHQFPIF